MNQESKKKFVLSMTLSFGILTLFLIILLIFLINPSEKSTYTADMVVLSGKTNTPLLPTLTPTIIPTSTVGIRPSPLPGTIGIGGYVQVFGTDGTSLNIRTAPNLNGTVVFQALDGELFVVMDGPQTNDGYTWWQISSSVDSSRDGWAVDNYLAPITK